MVNTEPNLAKAKLLIVISSDHYVRNYITTDAFKELKKDYKCSYLLSKAVKDSSHFSSDDNVRYYGFDQGIHSKHFKMFNLLMWRYRNKSKSFKFRIKRIYGLNLLFPENTNLFIRALKTIWRVLRWLKNKSAFDLFSNRVVFPLYYKHLKKTLVINPDIASLIEELRPALVLFPSSAYDPDGIDLVRVCDKFKIPTLFLVDNWDNLSSKSVLWVKPTHIGVWGEQSVEHACEIQGFHISQVTCLGTPRFDEYFRVRDTCLNSYFDYKYILFVGTAIAYDEAGALEKLNKIITENQGLFAGVKLVYRPHPWRQGVDTIIGMNLAHVVVDPQLVDTYSREDSSQKAQPAISYYPSLLQNAEFVIGGLTSMLIEALIFRKRFLALVYDDGKNLTSQHNAFKYSKHFEGLDTVEAISLCDNINKLEDSLIDVWQRRDNLDAEKVDGQRRYYYYDDSRVYGERLRDLCKDILA